MLEPEFWRIVNRAVQEKLEQEFRTEFGLTESQATTWRLESLLFELPPDDVLRFHKLMRQVYERAYRRDLWSAFGLALSGMDADLFRDCVSWLILRGRRRFEKTLANPGTLSSEVLDADEVVGAGGLADAAHAVLEGNYELEDFVDLIVYDGPPHADEWRPGSEQAGAPR
jgi:uncharacterized protein DUF4240